MIGTMIYREIGNADEATLNWLDARGQLFTILDDKNVEHMFVDNEAPRDSEISLAIVEGTTGYTIFTENGDRVGSYRDLAKAISAQSRAKIIVSSEVVEEDEPVAKTAALPFGEVTETTTKLK